MNATTMSSAAKAWTLAASISREYRQATAGCWTIFMNGHVPKVEKVPISGLAVTLDEAAS